MSTRTFPFSTLINKQTSVFPALDDADVILERRDAENLVLMRSERFEALADGLRLAARSLSVVARANRSLAEEVFSEELPWLTWLPAEARPECIRELLDHLLAGADTGLLIPFARALREWKSTAEIYSDPDLAHRLRGPFDTSEAVDLSRPGGESVE
jgi:PHD/YefM family antitoxin component YafN of YafNO toxin-antitoxin module